ncbi:MAG: PD-(D/E)XK nuclease family protein [Myxococcales bacterium]|nr:PD-(D/E)XK nuclease family protein [Myxococcales bacterium]
MALTHEFAWSASRASNFAECRRRHYYSYYGGWLGWDSRAEPARREIYQLGKLKRMPMVAGSAVHESLSDYFHAKPGHVADVKETTDRALSKLRESFRESQSGKGRQSPSRFTHLAEHYYHEDSVKDRAAVASYGKHYVERIERCVQGFFALRELAWVREASPNDYVFVENSQNAFGSFMLRGTKVFGTPDFALRDGDGNVHLYDWKTGRPTEDDAFQLHVYAIFAREEWGVPLERFSGYDVYLDGGGVVRCEITAESLVAAENRIQASADAMRELHFNADRGMGDAEIFPLIPLDSPAARACARCNFRELCGR